MLRYQLFLIITLQISKCVVDTPSSRTFLFAQKQPIPVFSWVYVLITPSLPRMKPEFSTLCGFLVSKTRLKCSFSRWFLFCCVPLQDILYYFTLSSSFKMIGQPADFYQPLAKNEKDNINTTAIIHVKLLIILIYAFFSIMLKHTKI